MPLDLHHLARWTPLIFSLSTICGFLLLNRLGRDASLGPERGVPEKIKSTAADEDEDALDTQDTVQVRPDEFPPTGDEIDNRIEGFISSIGVEAVCRLASEYNNHKPCKVTRRENGSFNVCFFVLFDDEDLTWVVRVPLQPVVQNPWDKIQSEVITMQYIERRTTIPVPHVYAYGTAELIKGGVQQFLICSLLPGRPLQMQLLSKATEEQRLRLYDGIIDTLAQLNTLEFPTSGSLMPGSQGAHEPVVGNLLSMATNELQISSSHHESPTTFASSEQYLAYQYHVLSETSRLPTSDLSLEDAQQEVFALESLANLIANLPVPSAQPDGFVLAHMDMRCGNILVTDEFQICGIVDWEFACTVPRCLFTPPPWLTGHDLSAVKRYSYAAPFPHNEIYPEFLQALEAKSALRSDCARLRDHWKYQPDHTFAIAQAFREPAHLNLIYHIFLFPKLFNGDRSTVVADYLKENGILAAEVTRRLERSEQYARYLEDQAFR